MPDLPQVDTSVIQSAPLASQGLHTQIPMANATQQASNPVQPFDMPDLNAAYDVETRHATAIAKNKQDLQNIEEGTRDKILIEQYEKTHPEMDFMKPDDVLQARKELRGKLSLSGENNLQQLAETRKLNILKTQSELSKMSSDVLSNQKEKLEFGAQYINYPMLASYEKVKAAGGSEQDALNAFNASKQASMQLASQIKDSSGQPMYTPEMLKGLSEATPDRVRDVISHSKFMADHVAAESTRRKEAATSEELLGRAEKDRAAAEFLRKRASGDVETTKMEPKTMIVDGEQTAVNFHPMTGKYTLPSGEDVTERVKPVEKGGLTPVQMGTVEKDIFEAKKFLERTGDKQTSSLFFLDQSDKGAVRRFTENKLTKEESQIYDVYANRLANAIVGMQSLGRYRGAVKSIDEARKMVPSPGDTPATIKAKRDYIEEFTRDSDDELSKLSKNTHRTKIMEPKKKPANVQPEISDADMKLLDLYPAAPTGDK